MTLSTGLSASNWQPNDQELIRSALGLLATVPCLDAISRAMADLEQQHPPGVLQARRLLDAIGQIDLQLLAGGPEFEQAVQKQSFSGPLATSSAAAGEAPLQKADVIAYDTTLLRSESEKVFANPASTAAAYLLQRRRWSDQLLLLLPGLRGWVVVAQGNGTTAWGQTPLQPYANARLLLRQTLIPADSTSAVVAAHVLECFLVRQRYISSKENGPGVDTGDFTYGGMICRASRLPPEPGAIWLGDLSLLNAAGDADVDPYALHHPFTALEFGASYGSGGIGALVQPLIGERVFGTIKPLLLS